MSDIVFFLLFCNAYSAQRMGLGGARQTAIFTSQVITVKISNPGATLQYDLADSEAFIEYVVYIRKKSFISGTCPS